MVIKILKRKKILSVNVNRDYSFNINNYANINSNVGNIIVSYENIEEKFKKLGAKIERVNED